MGPMNDLVVSSDAYNAAFGDRRAIAVEADSRSVDEGTYREPIVDAGTALSDRLVWVASRTACRCGDADPRARREPGVTSAESGR